MIILNTLTGLKITESLRNIKSLKIMKNSLMEKSITSSSAWVKFFDQSMARLRFKFNGKNLTETEILNLLSSTDSKS